MNFDDFSRLNLKRCEEEFNHPLSGWSLSDWAVAMSGEAGEACNVIKKMNRIRDGVDGWKGEDVEPELLIQLAHEIGDVYAYLDLLAQAAGLKIFEDCIAPKFNLVSDKIGAPQKVDLGGGHG